MDHDKQHIKTKMLEQFLIRHTKASKLINVIQRQDKKCHVT